MTEILWTAALLTTLLGATITVVLRSRGVRWELLRLFGVALLARLPFAAVPVNWAEVIYPDDRYQTVAPALWHLQAVLLRVLPAGWAPTDIIHALVRVAAALTAPLFFLAFRPLVADVWPPTLLRTSALVLALLPVLWFMGTTDCQHVIAQLVWLFGLLMWTDAVRGQRLAIPGFLLAVGMLPAVRVETAVWTFAWFVLVPPQRHERIALRVAALGVVGTLSALALARVNGPQLRWKLLLNLPDLLLWPAEALYSLTHTGLAYALLLGLAALGGRTLFAAHRRLFVQTHLAFTLLATPCLLAKGSIYNGSCCATCCL